MTNKGEETKMVEIEIDFTEDEIARIEERAKLMGISFDEFVRQSLAETLATPPTEKEDQEPNK